MTYRAKSENVTKVESKLTCISKVMSITLIQKHNDDIAVDDSTDVVDAGTSNCSNQTSDALTNSLQLRL